mmetsp:Transcript_40755/g.85616  ORF Transcript_40755/g.85616 Transcript_40755/m.85616 type:complete len:288 (+) Transcript_40755:171-1034(+)|eukprot:CAMPEP_0183729874 /NCGR_PEP_ID=MMETSP0737-20130205/31416_1 /TAXON_ID=385413 /ORGANISM="Thalassiosira miniscula, Strain CCMP1093" /LENGTH=287 /DNA_ID=CAMNT_0025962185 /DNA_START=134 /DNA_END=997 /DNA_ORIENTATION=-
MATPLIFLQTVILTLCIQAIASTGFQPHQPSTRNLPPSSSSIQRFQSSTDAEPAIMNEDLNIAILGGGNVGTILAQKLQQSNKFASITIAARNLEKTCIDVKAKGLDLDVASMEDVLPRAQVIILATRGIYDDDELQQFAQQLEEMVSPSSSSSGIIIIDATNPLGPYEEGLPIRTWEDGMSSTEKLASYLPSSTFKVYKSFNTLGLEHMKEALGKDMMIAGDPDPMYRLIAEEVVKGVGFKPFYVGPIRYARNLEALAEMWIHMAIPGLGGRCASRNFWFSISGDP